MQQAMEYIDYTDQVQVDYSHLQKSKLKFKKGQRAKSVYHYTSIGGLESILRNKTLRFTNIKYMNDKDEIIAGLDSIAKDCNASDEVREQMRLAITNLGMQLFVCCFSLKEVFGIFCSIANITHLIFRILSNTPTSQFGFESQVDQISPEIKPLQ